jgi:hypothetical protein
MQLLLICPHCRTNITLTCQACPSCGADLRDLPPQDRHYLIVKSTEAATLPLGPEMVHPAPSKTKDIMKIDSAEMSPETPFLAKKDVSLCEALDRVLNKGAVLFGEVLISVADIDLIYLGLQVILSSMDTARGFKPISETGQV